MAYYLDPKNDLTFKRVFGEHKNLCISLINSMLPLDESQRVVSIEYDTGELLPELEILRNSIVDVRCTDAIGRQFIVEMQMYWTESFRSRVLLNASKAYVRQLDRAEKYELLQPVYALNFVNENFEKSPEMKFEYYHHYKIVNIKDTQKQINGLEFVFIELKKFVPQNRAEKKLHELWMRFLTEINESTEEVPQVLLENAETREAVKYLEAGAYTKKQLFTYDKYRDAILTERSILSDAERTGMEQGIRKGIEKGIEQGMEQGIRKGMEKGIRKGIEQGMEQGIRKGIEKGIEQGMEQGIRKGIEKGIEQGMEKGIEKVAAACLKKGMSLEDVTELTGLTADEIRKLQ